MKRLKMTIGELWPCIRTTRTIAVNEELIVSGYGGGYWQRFVRETNWNQVEPTELYRLTFLQPRLIKWCNERMEMEETGARGVKRPRDE